MKKNLLLLLICIILAAPCLQAQSKFPKPTGKILLLSDIHFNPFYNPAIVSQLIAADYTQWEQIFDSAGDASFGAYGADSYYPLYNSAVKAMQAVNNKPDLIIITGDFIAHNFENLYYQFAPSENMETCNNMALQEFIEKTVSFVALQISKKYPNTPILPVLGNNDDFSGDYHISPNGPFLTFFAQLWQPMLKNMNGVGNFNSTFSQGGYYAVSMPWDTTQVFIGLNSVFFSSDYFDMCGNGTNPNPGWQQLQWLQNVLSNCAAQKKKVWMAYHIPPGVNVYPTAKYYWPTCSGSISLMWQQSYNDSFLNIIKKYSKTIVAGFAGHTHMDDFRIIDNNGKPVSFIHITPAISPIFSNNPGFQQVTWNTKDMTLQNNVTHYFKGIEYADSNVWKPEYDFNKTYGVKGINTKTLNTIWNRMSTDPITQNNYLKYYPVDNPTQQPNPWRAYWCAIRMLTETDYAGCCTSSSNNNTNTK